MTRPVPGPSGRPPVPGPGGSAGDGAALEEAVRALEGRSADDLDGILAAAENVHEHLRERLGRAGGR